MQGTSATKALTELTDFLIPLVETKKISKKVGTEMVERIEALQAAITNPEPPGNATRKIISSFDDWEERVYDVVEFVRPDDTITVFKIQSVTAAEQRSWRAKRNAIAPVQPTPRDNGKGGGPDLEDSHYKEDMLVYEEKLAELEEYMTLWILEAGLVDIVIPGDNDEEKLVAVRSRIGGDWGKIGTAIYVISNLTPEGMRPF